MNDFSDVATISQTLARAKAENMPIPETALRHWVKDGDVPASFVGKNHGFCYDRHTRRMRRI